MINIKININITISDSLCNSLDCILDKEYNGREEFWEVIKTALENYFKEEIVGPGHESEYNIEIK